MKKGMLYAYARVGLVLFLAVVVAYLAITGRPVEDTIAAVFMTAVGYLYGKSSNGNNR